MGLFDMVMLKDNHIDFCGGIEKAIDEAMKDIGPILSKRQSHLDYYSQQAVEERAHASSIYPELKEDGSWNLYKLVGALASNSTSLSENVTEQLDAWKNFRETGRFGVKISRSPIGDARLESSEFTLHGGAQATKAHLP
jgi:hypothetical protein